MAVATAILGTKNWDDSAVKFALLESFLVHARNLHDFLRPRPDPAKRRPGDFWASDYIEGFGLEVFDREMMEAINRWLQHLTTWRLANDHARWHPVRMLVLIWHGMDSFLAGLDKELGAGLLATHNRAGELLRQAGLLDS